MTKVAVLLHGGHNYALGDNADLFASLDDAAFVYRACEDFGFDPRTSLGTPCWGDGHEPGDVVGWAWKHEHDNQAVIEAEKAGVPLTVERVGGNDQPAFLTVEADYQLVKLPRAGYKWRKAIV